VGYYEEHTDLVKDIVWLVHVSLTLWAPQIVWRYQLILNFSSYAD
jgi:hypothetical protein